MPSAKRPHVHPTPSTGLSKTGAADVSALLSALLGKKDPSWAQLNKIIKRKKEQASDFGFQNVQLPEFDVPGKSKNLFSSDEKSVILLEARLKALESEREALKKKVVETEKAAHARGFAEGSEHGHKEGYAQAKKEMDQRVEALQQQATAVLSQTEKQRAEILHETERTATRLLLLLVGKIIQSETTTNPEIIGNVTRMALQHIGESQRLTVRVHPDDAQKVRDELPLWIPVNSALTQTNVQEDARIERGGCIIDTESGSVDARMSTQMESLESLVESVWQETARPADSDSTPAQGS